jgi:hypothetical protein
LNRACCEQSAAAAAGVPAANHIRINTQGLGGPQADCTKPEGSAANGPDYQDGSDTDRVTYEVTLPPGTGGKISATATLYYQAIPPYYLNQRLRFASQPATDALAWFVQNLAVTGPLESWKLKLAEASASAS